MKIYIVSLLVSTVAVLISGYIFIPVLKKAKAGQPVYKYVEAHKDKNGTPTMGGLFFIIPSCIVFFTINGVSDSVATVSLTIGISFMLVGFLDDFIKIKYGKNEGLKPYQKVFFQFFIAVFAGLYAYYNGLTYFYIPFLKTAVNLGWVSVIVVATVFIAITNSVNLTDGLDGLASATAIVYLISVSALIYCENLFFGSGRYTNNGEPLIRLSLCLAGGITGFLFFNVNKAKVFMGDTGSLSLGGFLGSISLFSSNGFFIPIIGIMFVLSGISVIVQVVYFKKTGKRVFLMAPLHHHLQLKGKTESQISYAYALITAFAGCISVLFYL